jgi:hypothetical protein
MKKLLLLLLALPLYCFGQDSSILGYSYSVKIKVQKHY